MANDWKIGRTRLRDKHGFTGTIAYVGTVASSKNPDEIYAGVVWDDVTRGKHDGSVVDTNGNLHRHFSAPHPTCASFVKVSKVDTGIALRPEVWHERYVDQESPEIEAPNNLLPHRAQTASGRNDKPIEFLGEMKIRARQQLDDLDSLSLRLWGISSIDGAADWTGFQHARHLDLAGNLLFEWSDVSTLLRSLPKLSNLSLACNRLGDFDCATEILQEYTTMTHLNLREIGIRDMTCLLAVGRAFPSLVELSVANNQIAPESADPQKVADFFPLLELLDVSKCSLSSLEAFSQVPHLRHLIADDNPKLASICNGFPELEHIQLSSTAFSTWEQVAELNELSKLRRLRITQCALVREGSARLKILAHIPKLEVLNGSSVTDSERLDAARWYVRKALQDKQDAKEDVVFSHWTTTFPDILEAGTASYASDVLDGRLLDSLVTVTIRSMVANSCTMDPLIRKLPLQLSLGRLKALCMRHFGLDIDLQELHYSTEPGLSIPMDGDDDRDLAYFGLPDGCDVLIKEIDKKSLEAAEREAEKELQERISRQEDEAMALQEQQRRLQGLKR